MELNASFIGYKILVYTSKPPLKNQLSYYTTNYKGTSIEVKFSKVLLSSLSSASEDVFLVDENNIKEDLFGGSSYVCDINKASELIPYYSKGRYCYSPQNSPVNLRKYEVKIISEYVCAELNNAGYTTIADNIISAINYKSDYNKMIEKFPIPKEEEYIISEINWSKCLYSYSNKRPILFTGDTGTGKTQLAKVLNKTLFNYDLHPSQIFEGGHMTDPESFFFGTTVVKEGVKGSKTVYKKSSFFNTVQNLKSGVILIDEFLRAPDKSQNMFMTFLTDRVLLSPYDGDAAYLSDDVMIIATTNEGGNYLGGIMDSAIRNRFISIRLPYLSIEEEASRLVSRTNVPIEFATKVSTIGSQIRSAYYESRVSEIVSFRQSLDACEMYKFGFSEYEAIENFLHVFNDDDKYTVKGIFEAVLNNVPF